MKHTYSYSQLGFLLCAVLLIFSQPAFAQMTWAPAATVTVCPEETGNYTLSSIPASHRFASGIPPFVVGGRLINFPAISNGSATFQVQWADNPNGGKLTVAFERGDVDGNGNTTWTRVADQELTALIRSVRFQVGPGGGITVPYCSTAPFSLTVPAQAFLNVPNELVPAYLYEVPDSWGVQGATLVSSFPGTRSGFRVYQGARNITLTPTPGGDVNLRVFQYSSTCNQTYAPGQLYKFVSFPGTLQVQRQPTVAITAGPSSVVCGDRRPVTYTAQASQSQGNPSFGWTYPSGWAVQGPTSGTSIVLIPDGSSGGTVQVQALYNCAGSSGTATSPLLTVALQQLPRPVLTSSLAPGPNGAFAVICPNSTATLTAALVPANANTRYVWNSTGGLTLGAGQVTSLTTASNQVAVNAGTGTGQGSVTVSAFDGSVAGCSSPVSAPLNLFQGAPTRPVGAAFEIYGERFDYTVNNPTESAIVCPGENIMIYLAQQNPGVILEKTWQAYQLGGSTPQLVSTQSGYELFRFQPAYSPYLSYEIRYQERNACGWGPLMTLSLQTMDCDGGAEPFRTIPDLAAPVQAVYPNPADDQLNVEQGGGLVQLYNAQGQAMSSQTAKAGRIRLNVKKLPDGFYYLLYHNATGQPVRQQVRIAH